MPEGLNGEAGLVAERERRLKRELLSLQILAGKKTWDKARAAGQEISFTEAFEKRSNFFNQFRFNFPNDSDEEEINRAANEWRAKINQAFDDGREGWLDQVEQVFSDLNEVIDFGLRERPVLKQREYAGPFYYEITPGPKGLEAFGIREVDDVLTIHFEDFYKRAHEGGIRKTVREGLQKIAIFIVDKAPQIKAITGFSWLIDHPLAKEIGFQIIDGEWPGGRGGSSWSQFIDRHGEINQARRQQFLETDEFPFKAKLGLIPVVDFLRRYLPAERRGVITLYETNPGWRDLRKAFSEAFKEIKERWNELSVSELRRLLVQQEVFMEQLSEGGLKQQLIETLIKVRGEGGNLQAAEKALDEVGFGEKMSKHFSRIKPYQVEIP